MSQKPSIGTLERIVFIQEPTYLSILVILDTAYMYILALILMLKIYQTRHPDINASAHSAYMVMAVVILVGVTGVVSSILWILSKLIILFLLCMIWSEPDLGREESQGTRMAKMIRRSCFYSLLIGHVCSNL